MAIDWTKPFKAGGVTHRGLIPELAPEIPTKSPEDSDTLMHLSGYIFRAAIDEGLRRT